MAIAFKQGRAHREAGWRAIPACASGTRVWVGRCRSSCRRRRRLGHCIGLSALDEAQHPERVAAVLAQERAERFDLADAPLIRFALIRLAAERHRLVLSNHHIVMEGWSMPRSRGDL